VAAARTAKPDEPQSAEEENEVTRPSDLGFGPKEVEVDPIQPMPVQPQADDGMVDVRMAVTIEEFTYGNPHVFHKLEEGKRYRMPRHVASYLWNLGKLSNIA
jgi:hypothetical protein